MNKKILMITSSGGSGLKQAAKSIIQQIKKEDASAQIIERDVLLDWMKGFGWAASFYNWTQRTGSVFLQETFVRCQKYADCVFWVPLFFWVLCTLRKYDIDEIVDTQVVSISAFIKAARVYGFWKKKKVKVSRHVIDLPTDQCTHFFANVKRLSTKDKENFSLVSIKPLLKMGQTPDMFWQENCGLKEKDVICNGFIVREAFKQFLDFSKCDSTFFITIGTKNQQEKSILERLLEKKDAPYQLQKNSIIFSIAPENQVVVILLGTEPTKKAAYQYIAQFIEIAKLSNQRLFVFILCGKDADNSIYTWLMQVMKSKIDAVKQLILVPMSFQQEDVIASLFYRANLTITRSGGSTAMELMAISHGENWIHSQAKKRKTSHSLTYEDLLKGIPFWEGGNADYMKKYYHAKIVTADTVSDLYRTVFY